MGRCVLFTERPWTQKGTGTAVSREGGPGALSATLLTAELKHWNPNMKAMF